jgi:hypothetical protein
MTIPFRRLALTLLASACLMPPAFAAKVKAQTGKNADFSSYKTYQWLPPRVLTKSGIDENHPANPVLEEVLGRQLSLKGLNRLADGADLQIQVYLLSESTPQLEALIMVGVPAMGSPMIYDTPIAAMGRYNRQGTICVNLIDRRTKKSAWFAMVSDSLPNRVLKPEELRSKISKAAAKLFKEYPAKK